MFSRRAQLLEKNPPREGERVISTLKPYPAYKDSGVEWLGQVPEHWEVRRLKHICRFVYGDALPDASRKEGSIPVYGSNGRVGFHSVPNAQSPCIVIGRKGSFGKVQYSDVPVFAIDTTFFVDGRFTSAHLRWLFFALGWLCLDKVSKDSAVPGLDREDAYKRFLFLPPLPEQTAIVRFLDYMDRRIRRSIRAKQKLIKLLEEYRQALIHQAVTGKIDVRTGKRYPSYKDSGVPWLGKVPEHWEVRRIKTLFRETDERNGDGNGPLLSLTRARGIVPQAEASNRIASVEDLSNYKVCKSGDLIMNRMQAWSGMFAVSGIDGVISPDYSVFKPKAPIDVHYFEALFKTPLLVEEFAKRSKGIGSGFNRLYTPDFGAVPIASPPLSEQTAIVEYLDAQTAKLDAAIAAARREIELLREYRERLIADVVTGKVDVRGVAAQLPEEPPDQEAGTEEEEPVADELATVDSQEEANGEE